MKRRMIHREWEGEWSVQFIFSRHLRMIYVGAYGLMYGCTTDTDEHVLLFCYATYMYVHSNKDTVCSPNRTLCKSTSETSLYRTDSWVPVASVIERLHHTWRFHAHKHHWNTCMQYVSVHAGCEEIDNEIFTAQAIVLKAPTSRNGD